MSKLLEIFGKAITVDTADLIWHWLSALRLRKPDDPDWQSEDFCEIADLLGNMDIDKALEKLKFYLFENPDSAKARMVAVAICLHKNDVPGAIEQLQSIYMRQPSNTMALYTLGYCYERTGSQAQAMEFYQDCIKFKSHLQLPRQRMAAIYFKDGRRDKAIRHYEILTTEHPEDISSMVLLGYLYMSDKRYENAIDTFNMAIIAHPDNFHDDSQDAEITDFIEAGQFEHAIEMIQTLIDQVGDMPDLHVRMADVLSVWGRSSEAIAHYENALRTQPNYLEATIKLGTHYLRYHRQALAAEQFNRAVEINDEIVDAYIGLAIAQYHAGKIDESANTLSLSSAIQQNSTLLFRETATLHLQETLTETDESIPCQQIDTTELLTQVIRAHREQISATPRSADIYYRYGILMMVAGNLPEAIKAFDCAIEINPTHHRAHCKRAICLYETDDEHTAITTLIRPHPLDISTLELHYKVAILYCDKQRFSRALLGLEHTMADNFTGSDATPNIEVVLENLGLIDRAIANWERLTETAINAFGTRHR